MEKKGKKIEKEISKIKKSCDKVEEMIKPKKAKIRGDPVVELF
jgi:hypothetical protein